MAIVIKDFKGMVPAISPKLLPDNFAQIAENCDLRTGKLKPLKDIQTTETWITGTVLHSLYKDETADRWLYWPLTSGTYVKVIKGQVADGDNRLFYTGDGYPKQTDDTLFPGSGTPANTAQYRRLGVVPPTGNLNAELGGVHCGGGVVTYTLAYFYTYVCKWADGTEEESEPKDTVSVTFDSYEGCYVGVRGFVQPILASSGNNVTHFRVYRLTVGTASAEFQLVKMRPGAVGNPAVYDIPIADVPLVTTWVFDSNGAQNDLNDDPLGEVCPTEDWSPPPDDLSQIGQYTNGILGGFSGNKFCVSEPFIHYAWKEKNRIPINYEPVAWGTYKGMAIIATTAFPSIITGSDSNTLMQEVLPYNQGCLSARGFVMTDIGAIYPSPDGLALVNENGVEILTRNILTKEQWNDLPPGATPHSLLISFYYDNYYIGVWDTSQSGFIFDFKNEPYLTTFRLDVGTNYFFRGGTIDPIDDALYFLMWSGVGGSQNFARKWEGAATYLTDTFKSKIYSSPPINYSFAKVIGNQSAGTPVTFKLFGDGSQIQHGGGDWSKSVQDTDIFRLPAGQKYETHEVQVNSQAQVDFVILGSSGEEIAKIVETL